MSFHFHKLRRRRLLEAEAAAKTKALIEEAEPVETEEAEPVETEEAEPVKKGRVKKNG